MQVYIDKTPPTINVITNGEKESFTKTQTDIVKRTQDITINTNDNIKIKTSEYYYNPTNSNFDGIDSNVFEGDKKITNEGYYKIVAIDTSGNKTEIIILLDKSAPDIVVKYYKKGEETAKLNSTEVRKVAATKKNLSSEQILNSIDEENDIDELSESYKPKAVFATRAGSITVSNEAELRNAINNGYSTIIISTSINCYNALTIKDNITIRPSSEENAIRFSGWGSFITIQSGATLTLDSIVIDCRGMSSNRGLIAVNVQSNGKLVLKTNSIIDTGAGNTGTVINSGATAQIHSCHYAFADKGIVVKDNGTLSFYNTEGGRCSEFWSNSTAISFENFTGTCNFNQSNIRIKDNANGIVTNSSTGTINISNAEIFNNSNVGIDLGNGKLNITGGTIRNNKVGIYLNSNYTGKLTISNVNIHSNSQYAINHCKNADGSCTILGGSISGEIYLGQNDNYVNTNSDYPTFTVKPSTYFFKRKLVKTTNNTTANTEISKVTMTPNGEWYKYVNNEYIVVWKGCNVQVNYVDYYGNVLSTEKITGNLGENYTTSAKEISGYDIISIPSNASGTYTERDITIEYKYDLKNIAKVTFEDLLSGVVSAKFWYNASSQSFSGNGADFSNGTIFENYGYYKIVVTNGVGLEKELTFLLNKDSVKR